MQDQQRWVAPDVPAAPSATYADSRFASTSPLGGSVAVPVEPRQRSHWRDVTVAATLLVASVLTAVASLLPWRDYGPALNPDENGWRLANGAIGRGWIAVAIAIILAVAGVLLVAGRRSAGRIWARIGSTALLVASVVEWAFGDAGRRSGPGLGLWVMLVVGMVLMVVIGSVLPVGDADQ